MQKPSFARAAALALSFLVAFAGALGAGLVRAQHATAVLIGDSGAVVGGAPAAAALDDALHAALEAQPGVRVEGRVDHARYVLTGSIIEWQSRDLGDEHEVRCAVSIVVSDASGAVRAMLSGRAGARGEGNLDILRDRALFAATRSALRPLGTETLR